MHALSSPCDSGVTHQPLHASYMCRLTLQRSGGAGGAALAAGSDALRLQSRVQLLDETYQGQYMIGA